MNGELYAVSSTGYRAVAEDMTLLPGETLMLEVPPDVLAFIATQQARAEVTVRLRRSDWTQAPDSDLTAEKRADWQLYRQRLRELLLRSDLSELIWPQEPEE